MSTAPPRSSLARHVRRIALLVTCTSGVVLAALASSAAVPPAPDGASLFRTYCASCHGVSGRGDGPMLEFLRIPPTNLTRLAARQGGSFDREVVARAIDGRTRIGSHGSSEMPVWGDAFTSPVARDGDLVLRERVRAIVRHLESLQERQAP